MWHSRHIYPRTQCHRYLFVFFFRFTPMQVFASRQWRSILFNWIRSSEAWKKPITIERLLFVGVFIQTLAGTHFPAWIAQHSAAQSPNQRNTRLPTVPNNKFRNVTAILFLRHVWSQPFDSNSIERKVDYSSSPSVRCAFSIRLCIHRKLIYLLW